MTTKRKDQIDLEGIVKDAQNKPVTLDQALGSISSNDEVERINDVLDGLEEASLSVHRLKNRKPKMFDIHVHILLSARALLFLCSAIVGILLLLLKLFGH